MRSRSFAEWRLHDETAHLDFVKDVRDIETPLSSDGGEITTRSNNPPHASAIQSCFNDLALSLNGISALSISCGRTFDWTISSTESAILTHDNPLMRRMMKSHARIWSRIPDILTPYCLLMAERLKHVRTNPARMSGLDMPKRPRIYIHWVEVSMKRIRN